VATEQIKIQRSLRFGADFGLDLRSYELRRSGVRLKLEPTPFGILAFLLERHGELVSRQEIVERIWGKEVFLDTDNSINGAIRKIRQVLNDDPENPRFIQTVTGRGYKFIAPVAELEESPQRIHILQPPGPAKVDSPPRTSRISRAVVPAAGILVTLGLSLWLVPAVLHRTTGSTPIGSIAVLPLDNLSGDPSQDYFADAMTDELITELAKVGGLRVTSRTTVTLYRHTRKKLPEIARELNVDAIVEGSVVRSGQRVRVTAQLIRGSADQHLWAETYDRNFGDALQLQSDVTRAIIEHVRAQLTPELNAQFNASRSVDPISEAAITSITNRLPTPRPSIRRRRPLKTLSEETQAFLPPTRAWPKLTFAWRYSGKGGFRPRKHLGWQGKQFARLLSWIQTMAKPMMLSAR
jgi:TolB-like protein/DNA-binding winged helix-turn-helix (wHTH) protein